MPIVSAQSYVQGLLQGLTPPGATGIAEPIDAMITPLDPDVNPDGVARVYVWPAKAPERRIAMPRNDAATGNIGGWKKLTHDLEIFLVWMDSPDDPARDVNFPLFIDFVMGILRTAPNRNILYTAPETGATSQMVNIGEDMDYDFIPPRSLEPQMQMRYDARIRCTLLEIFQA